MSDTAAVSSPTIRADGRTAKPTLTIAALLMLVGTLLGAVPAHADSVVVRDNEGGQEAYFLAIARAKFTNGTSEIGMRATHPTLDTDLVDQFSLRMYVDRNVETFNRRTYYLVWQVQGDAQFRRGLHLYRSEPGMEYPIEVTCAGARMQRTSSNSATRRPGTVTARIPRRCIPGSRFIKFNYTVSNFGGNVHDSAPGGNDQFGDDTRWVARN